MAFVDAEFDASDADVAAEADAEAAAGVETSLRQLAEDFPSLSPGARAGVWESLNDEQREALRSGIFGDEEPAGVVDEDGSGELEPGVPSLVDEVARDFSAVHRGDPLFERAMGSAAATFQTMSARVRRGDLQVDPAVVAAAEDAWAEAELLRPWDARKSHLTQLAAHLLERGAVLAEPAAFVEADYNELSQRISLDGDIVQVERDVAGRERHTVLGPNPHALPAAGEPGSRVTRDGRIRSSLADVEASAGEAASPWDEPWNVELGDFAEMSPADQHRFMSEHPGEWQRLRSEAGISSSPTIPNGKAARR